MSFILEFYFSTLIISSFYTFDVETRRIQFPGFVTDSHIFLPALNPQNLQILFRNIFPYFIYSMSLISYLHIPPDIPSP